MQFGVRKTEAAAGAVLVHSVRAGGQLFRKGRVLSEADIAVLVAADMREVTVARLEPDDVGENEAAARIARACAGDKVGVGAAFTGRANLHATEAGLVLVDAERVAALNALDEAITLATVAPFALATPRQMLATVKIIPSRRRAGPVEAAERLLADGSLIRVAPFQPRRAALISTVLPQTKPALLDRNRAALEQRLAALGSQIVSETRVAHETEALAGAIRAAAGADPILIFGASAITDRRDVIPAAIAQAGGSVEHFGMPVDPGNLLLIGRLNGATIVGLPSCARSPKLNGVDFVLRRIAAGLPVGRREIAAMGVGGLLGEIATRPQPRDEQPDGPAHLPRIAAIVLAADCPRGWVRTSSWRRWAARRWCATRSRRRWQARPSR